MSGQGAGQGQGGTFGQSQGFNPQSLSGMPGFNNAMQRFAPQQQRDIGFDSVLPRSFEYAPGYSAPQPPMGGGQMPTLQPPQSQRYGVPPMQPPQMPTASPDFLAQHMAQRNAITNGYVDPGQQPSPQQLAAHLQANANYTNSYGTPGQVPLPPWLLPR